MKKNKVFVSGHFNVLHPGHLRLLRFAKESGNLLIVGVESDRIAGNAAYIPGELRLEGIEANSWVDEAFLMDEAVDEVILRIKPDIVVKGKEHEKLFNPELVALQKYGGKLVFSSGRSMFSTLDLIKKEVSNDNAYRLELPNKYLERHKIGLNRISQLIHDFKKLKVCVIGDFIVDEYITCEPLGMSQEDPTIVVAPIDSTKFIGGAGIVASHAAGLGAQVDFISISGNDLTREFAINALTKLDLSPDLLIDESRPTTLKQRFRSKGKTLLRVSHLHQGSISLDLQNQIYKKFEGVCSKKLDLVVFSDFNYGCLPQELLERLISLAKSKGIMLAADSQSSSQIGDISRFKGMNLITPTEHEGRLSTRDSESGLVILADDLRKRANAQNIFLKLGQDGLLIHSLSKKTGEFLTDRISALNPSPKDVSGAGDSLLISGAMTMALGGDIWESALLGSLAAAIQVGRLGNVPLDAKSLLDILVEGDK